MIRVADVTNSARFYRNLGFEIGNAVPRECPPFDWAWLYQPKAPNWKTGANLMLVSGDAPGTAESKAKTVLFYLYARDLKSLREELWGRASRRATSPILNTCRKVNFALRIPMGTS